MYNENVNKCEAPVMSAPVMPGPEPISGMLASACNLAETALAMATKINAHCFGIQPKEKDKINPQCMRDVMVYHVDCLKAICEELNDIMQGLGV